MTEYNRALHKALVFSVTGMVVVAILAGTILSLKDRNAKLTNGGKTPTEIGE